EPFCDFKNKDRLKAAPPGRTPAFAVSSFLRREEQTCKFRLLDGQLDACPARCSAKGIEARTIIMLLPTLVSLLLVFLITPVFLIRFRKRWVASFNLAVTNRITNRFAARLPGFGMVTHVGRKSGRVYQTPVNVFRFPDGFLIALTYGRERMG